MAETDTLHTITMEVTHTEEVFANKADLYVTIKGTSLFTGDTALKKAREVSQLVTELTQYGIEEKDIHLQSIRTETASGLLGKSSSALYNLRIRNNDLDGLADVLGIITSQKNTSLKRIEWIYEAEEDTKQDQWLEICIRRANVKIAKIAQELGVKVLGIHRFKDEYLDPEARRTPYKGGEQGFATIVGKASMGKDWGLEVTHSKEVVFKVQVEYIISEFASA